MLYNSKRHAYSRNSAEEMMFEEIKEELKGTKAKFEELRSFL